jgi:hypothetical protein
MDPELTQDPLGMMAGCVGADMQSVRDRGVRPALRQQRGNLELSPGKPVFVLQVRDTPWNCAVAAPAASLFLKLPAQLPHLPHGFTQLTKEQLAVAPEIRKAGKKIVQPIVGDSVPAM